MFKLQKMWGYNFWLFESFDLDFSELPDNSIIFIQGVNYDGSDATSNYAGKTTLFVDFFRWIVEDKYPRLKTVNEVIGTFDSYTMGGIKYTDQHNNELLINRYRKHPKYKNSLRIKWKGEWLIGERNIETTNILKKILGINSLQYIMGTLFTNNREEELLLKTPAVRNKELAEIWGILEFTEMTKMANKLIINLDKELNMLEGKLDLAKQLRYKIRKNIKQHKTDIENYNSNVDKELSAINDKLKKQVQLDELHNKINKDIKGYRKTIGLTKDSIIELKRRLADSQLVVEEINKIKTSIVKLKQKYDSIKYDIDSIDEEIDSIINSPQLKIGSYCIHCGSKVTASGKKVLIRQRKVKKASLAKKLDSTNSSIKKYRSLIKQKTKELGKYNVELVTDQISKLSKQLVDYQEKLANCKSQLSKVDSIQATISSLKKKRQQLRTGKNPYIGRLNQEIQELKKMNEQIASLKSTRKDINEQIKIYQTWAGSKGFKLLRNLILTEKVALMGNEFNKHLSAITDGNIVGEWSVIDNGDIECKFFDCVRNKEILFKGFSTSQQTKILFAQSLANSFIYTPHIKHISIDEKLDNAIDAVGVAYILDYIKSFKELGKRVFLISHNPEVKKYSDAVVRIERKQNKATAKLEVV